MSKKISNEDRSWAIDQFPTLLKLIDDGRWIYSRNELEKDFSGYKVMSWIYANLFLFLFLWFLVFLFTIFTIVVSFPFVIICFVFGYFERKRYENYSKAVDDLKSGKFSLSPSYKSGAQGAQQPSDLQRHDELDELQRQREKIEEEIKMKELGNQKETQKDQLDRPAVSIIAEREAKSSNQSPIRVDVYQGRVIYVSMDGKFTVQSSLEVFTSIDGAKAYIDENDSKAIRISKPSNKWGWIFLVIAAVVIIPTLFVASLSDNNVNSNLPSSFGQSSSQSVPVPAQEAGSPKIREVDEKKSIILSNGKSITVILPASTLDDLAMNLSRCSAIAYFTYESYQNGTFSFKQGISRDEGLEASKNAFLMSKKFVDNLNANINSQALGQAFYTEIIETLNGMKNAQGDSVAVAAATLIFREGTAACMDYYKSSSLQSILEKNNIEKMDMSIVQ